jgi:hypothetical protein
MAYRFQLGSSALPLGLELLTPISCDGNISKRMLAARNPVDNGRIFDSLNPDGIDRIGRRLPKITTPGRLDHTRDHALASSYPRVERQELDLNLTSTPDHAN